MTSEPFSIGHSTHPVDVFLELLGRHRIGALADVRRYPGSRKYPHFNRDALAATLPAAGVEYHWFEALGGRRKSAAGPSPNAGLRNESFRNYADYMATPAFEAALARLLELAARQPTAIMCSEGLFWRCHRRLISDALFARGIVVAHILPDGGLRPHALTEGGRIKGTAVTYPPPA